MSSHTDPATVPDAHRGVDFAASCEDTDRLNLYSLGKLAIAGDWGENEAVLLSELSRRLAPHTESIVREWTSRLVSQIDLQGADPDKTFEIVAALNRHFLQSHLAQLELGDLESVLRTNLDNDLELLRSQQSREPQARTTLLHVHLSIEISTAVICRWIREIYADEPQLPLVIATYSRFALLLTKIAAEASNQIRIEELGEALRVTSSLLDSSRELNTRSASVADVLSKLNNIVTRVVGCERSISYTWREGDRAYAVKDAVGFSDSELEQVRLYRFSPEMFPATRIVHSGETCSGMFDDGLVSRELMERHSLKAYALAPIIGSDGRPLGALAAYRIRPDVFTSADIQVLRGVAQNAGLAMENAVLVEELEVVSRLKGEFINSMSHEIRTPLNILFGYLEMLYDKHGDNDEDRHIFDRMRQNSHYVLTLVNTILDIGRIESGQMPINITSFHVEALLQDLEEMFGAHARSQGVAFSCSCDADLPALNTDRLKVLEILNNLVSNAFKFTDAGSVEVRVSLSSPDRRSVLFEVRDTGCGVDADSTEAIFELFRQVGGSSHGGTGLGLYIVRRLADLLHGHVEVDSAPGRGTVFRVSLPTSIS